MKTTKIHLVLALTIIFVMLVSFGCADVTVDPQVNVDGSGFTGDTKVKARKTYSQMINVNSQTAIKVEGINGSIYVESVLETDQITISGEKIVVSSTYQDASSHLDDITIDIDELVDEIVVKTLQPQFSNGRTYKVNYTIYIPSHLDVTMVNLNGSLQLKIPTTASANFYARLVNGKISLHNLILSNKVSTIRFVKGTLGNGQGTISLKTINGNIDVSGF